jgi:galactose-1-phosphate uridylyltransferase
MEDLSEGFTFINKNLYPVLFPPGQPGNNPPLVEGRSAYGLHFLQWTSSYHDRDWHNMPVDDCAIVISRLAALEKALIKKSPTGVPMGMHAEDLENAGHVLIFKNYGHPVGASLSHGHQQILLSSIAPAGTLDHLTFETKHNEVLSSMLLRETPTELMIRKYAEAVLLVPTFMRRPYEMFLIVKDTGKRYLHELSAQEIAAVGEGWHDATRLMHDIMPRLGKEVAFNVSVFNGPGAGIYFDFLPYTQPMGGLERIGLYVCQETPIRAAKTLRASLERMTVP